MSFPIINFIDLQGRHHSLPLSLPLSPLPSLPSTHQQPLLLHSIHSDMEYITGLYVKQLITMYVMVPLHLQRLVCGKCMFYMYASILYV